MMVAVIMPVMMIVAVVVVVVVIMMMIAVVIVTMVIVVMSVAMAVMVMPVMVMAVRHRHFVGAALGLERTLDLADLRTEPLQHVGDDVIAPDPEPGGPDLGLEMAIAEVPGEAHQMTGVAAADLGKLLRLGDDLDQPVIIEHEGIAMGERRAFGEIDQQRLAADRRHRPPPPAPVLKIQDDAVGERFAGQLGGTKKAMGVMHGTLNRIDEA